MRGCGATPLASLRRQGSDGMGEIVMVSCVIGCPGPTGMWGSTRPWSVAGSHEATELREGRVVPKDACDCKEIGEPSGGEGLPRFRAISSRAKMVGYGVPPPCVFGSCQVFVERETMSWAFSISRISLAWGTRRMPAQPRDSFSSPTPGDVVAAGDTCCVMRMCMLCGALEFFPGGLLARLSMV